MSTRESRFRTLMPVGIVAIVLLLELLIVTKVIPAAGSGRRGAPLPIVFQGLVFGLINALTATGIVLIYRSMRFINFAQTAIGGAGFALTYNFITLTPVPFALALLFGLVLSAGLGLMFEMIFVRRFFNAPRLVITVFTIVSAAFIGGFGRTIVNVLPIFPPPEERTTTQLSGSIDIRPELPFPNFKFTMPGSPVPFGFSELFAIGAAVAALIAVALFLRYTRLGVAVRALAENSERASLLGIGVGFISSIVWIISGLLSGVGSSLSGILGSAEGAFGLAPDLLLAALAACVLARMRSIWVAVTASVGIEVMIRSVQYLQPDLASLSTLGLLVIVAGGLLLQRSTEGRSDQMASTSWLASEEVRPIPKEMARLTPLRVTRWILLGLVCAGVVAYPFVTSSGQAYLGGVIALHAIIGLSLVILTGWTGQVSLGQFALAAVGAVIAGAISARAGMPFWIAVPIASLVAAAVAVLLGIPALRLPGLYLAVATFAFAAAVRDVLFNEQIFGWLLPSGEVKRPVLPFISFENERAMYFLAIGALIITLIAARNIRNSRFGRILIGLRENEANAESAGVSPLRMKLTAFAIAGGLAGFAGALLAFQQRGVSSRGFGTEASIDVFVLSVIGGVSSIFGPLVGSGVLNGIRQALAGAPEVGAGLAPLLAIVLLYLAPGGLISVVARIRDAGLRIIAQRNQLVVPSLFADIDPESMHLRLVPIAAKSSAEDGSGLGADERYDLLSMHTDIREDQAQRQDFQAFRAAAESVEPSESSLEDLEREVKT